jgi:hypothetical protein
MNTVCWHGLVNKLKEDIAMGDKTGDVPWLLSKDQLEFQTVLHSSIRAKNSIDLALEEVFDFEKPLKLSSNSQLKGCTSFQNDKTGALMTIREITDVLSRFGYGYMTIKRPALIKTLERLCGDYTGTRKNPISIAQPVCTIHRGLAKQGTHSRWVLPPVKSGLSKIFGEMP